MAYSAADLSVLAYANNFTLWHYKTVDADVTTAGYFNGAADMMNVNDLIIANVDTDGSPATVFYIVTAVSSGNVTVAAFTA
ncbi:MAG: hypothetical protein AAF569_04070 [Pseudomonadota bacterium]